MSVRPWPEFPWMSSPHILSQQSIEASNEAPMAICLVDPAPCLGIGSECLGIDPLSREDRDAGTIGAEVGAVLADVGVGTRPLGRGTKAVAAGKACFDRWRITPVPITGDRDPKPLGRQWSDAGLGQIERPFVLGSNRGVEEPTITEAHRRRDVAE